MSSATVETTEDAAFDRLDGDVQCAGEDDAETAANYVRYQQMGKKQAVQIEAAGLILVRNDAPAIGRRLALARAARQSGQGDEEAPRERSLLQSRTTAEGGILRDRHTVRCMEWPRAQRP